MSLRTRTTCSTGRTRDWVSPIRPYREQALPIYEEIGDLIGQANVLNNLGVDAYFEGAGTRR